MRNPRHNLLRPLAAATALSLCLTLLGAGSASAATAIEPEAMTAGILGPVGLVAVVLGVVGMALGILRQRRKARATQPVTPPQAHEEPTRPTLQPHA